MPGGLKTKFPFITERAAAALPQGTTEKLFTINGGRVVITSIVGEVTTVLPATANATKLIFDPTGTGSNIDLCATLDISAKALGIQLSIVGVLATALKGTSIWCVVPADNIAAPGLVLGQGDILLSCVGSMASGAVKWTVNWYPLDNGGNLFMVPH